MEYRWENCFDRKTIELAKSSGVHSYVFDCNPRSFHFCPLHQIAELIEEFPESTFTLKLPAESEKTIHSLLEELKKQIGKFPLTIEFACEMNQEKLNALDFPVGYHLSSAKMDELLIEHKNLEYLVIDDWMLEDLQGNHDLLKKVLNFANERKVIVGLSGKTGHLPSVSEFLKIEGYSLILSDHFMADYRQIDTGRILDFWTGMKLQLEGENENLINK